MPLDLPTVDIPAKDAQTLHPQAYTTHREFAFDKDGEYLEIRRAVRVLDDKGDLIPDDQLPPDYARVEPYILRLRIEMIAGFAPQYASFAQDVEKITDILDPKLEHLPPR